MKKRKIGAVSLALVTLVTSGVGISNNILGNVDAGEAISGNAKQNAKKASDLNKDEKREIMKKIGFIDETINVLKDNEIDQYVQNYLSGLDLEAVTTTQLINEEEILKEDFAADKEDFLQCVDYSLSEEEVQEQIEQVTQEYEYKHEMYEDFNNMDRDELQDKYGYNDVEVKSIQNIAEDVSEEKNKEDSEVDGSAVHGCASNASVTVTFSYGTDYTFDTMTGKHVKLNMIYNKTSTYQAPDNIYKDIASVAWSGDHGNLEVEAVTYRHNYSVKYYNGISRDVAEGAHDLEYVGSSHTGKDVCGIVNHRTDRTLDSSDYFDNINRGHMVCWSGQQLLTRSYKGGSVGYVPSSGVNTIYAKRTGTDVKIYSEYIHRTSSLSTSYKGGIGEDYYEDFFKPGKQLNAFYSRILNAALSATPSYVGEAVSSIKWVNENFVHPKNYCGPATYIDNNWHFK